MAKLIEIKDLVTNFYTYEGVVKALNGVSLDVEEGITLGLVGESGCGKSVTVRSMMRIIQAPGKIESGQVIFHTEENGKKTAVDLLQQSEAYMQKLRGNRISMIFQEPNAALNPILSIGDQVSESFLLHRKEEMCGKVLKDIESPGDRTIPVLKPWLRFVYGLAAGNPGSPLLKLIGRVPVLNRWDTRLKKEALERSVEIIGKLSIPNPEELILRYPHNLSGGMKQRIVIAMALACNPVLLVADESTSNLDVTIQAQILELLNKLKKDVISSILLITHDLGVVAETCDRVGVMYAGNLCEVADVKDLFRNPKHPYTRALLKSVPRKHQEERLETIEGSVPNLVTPPPGCRFHPRCRHVMEKCRKEMPELTDMGNNHLVACHGVNS
ncbi:MAG: ABC transporter ATP-binding protein [Desulfobacteraceae bacterium]|nr:ABC transporter ATP-binding protein [Desulfobacteraceae bacterium]